jgi:hypothetical protein
MLTVINQRSGLLAGVILLFSSSLNAGVLDKVPEVSSASEGIALIQKDSFGGIELAWLIKQRGKIGSTERAFTSEMGNGYHGVSLIEPFGRVRLMYGIFIDHNTPDADSVFDVNKEMIIKHFTNLQVGDWSKADEVSFKKYKWKWVSGDFNCEAIFDFWEPKEPALTYECSSINTE